MLRQREFIRFYASSEAKRCTRSVDNPGVSFLMDQIVTGVKSIMQPGCSRLQPCLAEGDRVSAPQSRESIQVANDGRRRSPDKSTRRHLSIKLTRESESFRRRKPSGYLQFCRGKTHLQDARCQLVFFSECFLRLEHSLCGLFGLCNSQDVLPQA